MSRSSTPDTIINATIAETTNILAFLRKEDINMSQFIVGDEVKVSYNITVQDVYTDPTTPTINVLNPSGTKTTFTIADPEMTKLDVGKYEIDVDVTLAGEWIVLWVGDSPAQGVQESRFYAKQSAAS